VPALGAALKKGGAYAGELPETAARLEKRVVLKGSASLVEEGDES
jgi:hypothetical protein